jgi:hypothetical protein
MAAGFNRRIRKTVRTVVWEGDGAQSPSLDPIKSMPVAVFAVSEQLGLQGAWQRQLGPAQRAL